MGKNAQKRKPEMRLSNTLMPHVSLRGEFGFGEKPVEAVLASQCDELPPIG